MGVEHIDFYGVNRATQLPLINVSVPTRLFFLAAPLLIAAVYGYFHLYLIRLWDALGAAPAQIKGAPLGEAVTPWLVTDAALFRRRRKLGDGSANPRPMEWAAMWLNILLAWAFGPVILTFLWWQSMTARALWMTGLAGCALLIGLWAGITSWVVMRRRMVGLTKTDPMPAWRRGVVALIFTLALALTGVLTVERSTGRFDVAGKLGTWELATFHPGTDPADVELLSAKVLGLAPIVLVGEDLVEHPADWLPHAIAREEFEATWCDRETPTCDNLQDGMPEAFEAEWQTRRRAYISALDKPQFNPISSVRDRNVFRQPSDLRGAGLFDAFLPGINLRGADLRNVNLERAQIEGAALNEAHMQGANLFQAQMQGAALWRAQMQGASLSLAQMEGAIFTGAQMEGASLQRAQMQGAALWRAQMQGASLSLAQMEGAALQRAQMEGVDLSGAQMEGANLFQAQMEGANLSFSLLTGTLDRVNTLQSTNLNAVTNNGGALRLVDLSEAEFDNATDFRNVFLDGSVEMSDAFIEQMHVNGEEPCQWQRDRVIEDDAEFFGLWRAWVEKGQTLWDWSNLAPPEWRDVEPIPIPNCDWAPPLADE